jgi:DnaJ family protein C protein 2
MNVDIYFTNKYLFILINIYCRWEVVANFINQHTVGEFVPRTPKEVLAKAKDLQSCDYSRNILKVAANQKAYDNFEKDHKVSIEVSAATSQRFDSKCN